MFIEIVCPAIRPALAAVLTPSNLLMRQDAVLSDFVVLLDWVLALGVCVGVGFALASFTVRHWIACGLDAFVAWCKRSRHAD